jgi:hypothetical protein
MGLFLQAVSMGLFLQAVSALQTSIRVLFRENVSQQLISVGGFARRVGESLCINWNKKAD